MGLEDVYVISACRTPIGAFKGQFSMTPASTLGGQAMKTALQRINFGSQNISEVIMGQMLSDSGENEAHEAAIEAGISPAIPATTVNMRSASSLKAIFVGYQAVRNDDAKFVMCGGQENASIGCSLYKDDVGTLHDYSLGFSTNNMTTVVEGLVRLYDVKRQEQDQFAYRSHGKAASAILHNVFELQMATVHPPNTMIRFNKDEVFKPHINQEELQAMPRFHDDVHGYTSITPGTVACPGDGAAVVILCKGKTAAEKRQIPFVKIVAIAQTGEEEIEVGLGTADAIEKVLNIAQWTKDEVDLFELDEMFAAQPLLVIQKLGLDITKVNVTGGSIALRDPLGASGARMLVTLIHNLKRLNLQKGIVAQCIDGGMGIAIAVQQATTKMKYQPRGGFVLTLDDD